MKKILSFSLALIIIISQFFSVLADDDDSEEESYNDEKTVHKIDFELLESFSNTHPRLFLDSEKVKQLKIDITGKFADEWKEIKRTTDEYLATSPPDYYVSANREENWMRGEADKIPFFSFCYLMTGDKAYYEAAKKWALKLCSYPSWGGKGTNYYNKDLSCAHALVGIALFYDWTYDDIDLRTRTTILNTIIDRGSTMASGGWWSSSFLQNHSWRDWSATVTSGIAIMDEYPNAKNWFKKCVDGYDSIHYLLGDDGCSHEGILYWRYGADPYTQFLINAKKFFGIDYTDNPWPQNNYLYPIYFFFGKDSWNSGMYLNFGDAARQTSYMEIKNIMTFYARTYQNGYAQQFANDLSDYMKKKKNPFSWMSLIIEGDDPEPKPYSDLPDSHVFTDMGYVIMRSDWGGSETVLGFRCGNKLGKSSVGKYSYNPGSGHVHSDLNHINLFSGQEWLLRDDGYVTTNGAQHSTLLIDGDGQVKSTDYEENIKDHKILAFEDTEDYTYAVGDATLGYSDEQQVKKFYRHFLYMKKLSALIVVDDVETKNPKLMTLRFIPESNDYDMQSDGSYMFYGNKTKMLIKPLELDDSAAVSTDMQKFSFGNKVTLDINAQKSNWLNSTAVSWSSNDQSPQAVSGKQDEKNAKLWIYKVGAYTINLNTDKFEVTLNKPQYDVNVSLNGRLLSGYTVPPTADNEKRLMPLRKICEEDGKKVLYDEQTRTVKVIANGKAFYVPTDSDGVEITDGTTMVTPEYFTSNLYGVCYYDEVAKIFTVKTENLGSDTTLKSITFGGASVSECEEGKYEYALTAIGDFSEFFAVPNDSNANIVTRKISENEFTITVTAEDKINTAEYIVHITRPSFMGNIPIYNAYASSDDGNLPRNTVDGNLATRWSGEGVGEYIVWELDGSYYLDRADIYWFSADIRSCYGDLYVSEDGENYTYICDASSTLGEEQPIKLDTGGIKCRYIKLIGRANSANLWNSIAEVGFEGKLTEGN